MHEVAEATTSAFSVWRGDKEQLEQRQIREHGRGITSEAYAGMLMWIQFTKEVYHSFKVCYICFETSMVYVIHDRVS